MGRKIENHRKISNYRVRNIKKPKSKVLIAVEGNNKTEKMYFNNFESRDKSFNITYAKGNNTDPVKLVKMLIKEIKKLNIDLKGEDVAYCIFDTDVNPNKNKLIKEATTLANKNNIGIITSAPSIEMWFLLHFDFTTSYMNNEEVMNKLKKYYPKYEKADNIYPFIKDNTNIAIKRAKKLEKYHSDNHKIIGTIEANPNSEIYKIVEYLLNK